MRFLRSLIVAGCALSAAPAVAVDAPQPGARISFQSGINTLIEGYEGALTKTSNGNVWLGFIGQPTGGWITKGDLEKYDFKPGSKMTFEYAQREGSRSPTYVTVDLRTLRNETVTVRGKSYETAVVEATLTSARPVWTYRMQAWVEPTLRYMLRREIVAMADSMPNPPAALRVTNIQPPAVAK